ncbi:MAG: methyltransferase domain-containing protein [Patescibacteria group bacterium]
MIIGLHIRKQLDFLKKILPEDFRGREMHDLGCGDGKVTVILKGILKAKDCYGYDTNEKLIKLSREKGIKTEKMDLEKSLPKGELAIFWGVLHHLKSPREVLKRVKSNFKYLIFREPLKKGITLFELGKPFRAEQIEKILKDSLGDYESYIYKNAIFVFWRKKH